MCVSLFNISAQMVPARFEEARNLYAHLAYSEAIPILVNECISNKNKFLEAEIMLADCYRQTNDYVKAEAEYNIISLDIRLKDEKQRLYYAQILQNNQKYDLAAFWYNKYLLKFPQDKRAQNQMEACKNLEQFSTDKRYSITNLSLNTNGYDFGACIKNNVLYFISTGGKSAAVKPKDINLWTGERFMDLYTSNIIENDSTADEFSIPVSMPKTVNTKYNEGPLCFNKEKTKVYFTRNQYNPDEKNKLYYSKQKEANLTIFEATIDKGNWINIKELPFNNKEYSCGHPVWDDDDSILYFTSTMPGGYGGTDLWKSKLSNSKWEKPANLGSVINTEGDEMFPAMDVNKNFYFASDGHGGLGGLDIFSAKKSDGVFSNVKNLGTPINSSYDDFGYLINENNTIGFFSSDRPGGKGEDDIYRFADVKYELEVTIIDKFTKEPIATSLVQLKEKDEIKNKLSSNNNGVSQTRVEGGSEYILDAEAPNYLPGTINKQILANEKRPFNKVTIELQPLVLQVSVINAETKKPVAGAVLNCTNACTNKTKTSIADETGITAYTVLNNCTYTLDASAKSYLPKPVTQITTTLKDTTFIVIELTQINDKAIALNNIYYDFNKWDIRPEAEQDLKMLLQFMKQNPDAILELSSNTDSRGEDKYNLDLSQKRAQSAVNWLVTRGVYENNIKPVGYGETKPLNACINNVKCSEEDHQKNRRTEFKVLNAGQVIASQVKQDVSVDPCRNCPF